MAIEVKIECPCGTRYKFDIEPVQGRMPAAVQCPGCGADGTDAANECIARTLRDAPSIGAPPAAPTIPLPPVPVMAPVAPPLPKPPRRRGPSFKMGIVGALLGGFVATLGWYGLIRTTGYTLGIAAWGVGAATGLSARWLAKAEITALGPVAGGCAFLAILLGQFLAINSIFNSYVGKAIQGLYENEWLRAEQAVNARTDDDVRRLIATRLKTVDGSPANPAEVLDQQVSDFRLHELPRYQQFLAGKPSRAEYAAKIRQYVRSKISYGKVFKESLSFFTLLWVFLGIGTASRIAGDEIFGW